MRVILDRTTSVASRESEHEAARYCCRPLADTAMLGNMLLSPVIRLPERPAPTVSDPSSIGSAGDEPQRGTAYLPRSRDNAMYTTFVYNDAE
jgi:hypothetical protein